jgi:hypothetical protein
MTHNFALERIAGRIFAAFWWVPESGHCNGRPWGRIRPPAVANAAAQRVWESHTVFFETAACDCTCECWGFVGTPQDTSPPPNRRPFPTLSHRIKVLTPISYPHVS